MRKFWFSPPQLSSYPISPSQDGLLPLRLPYLSTKKKWSISNHRPLAPWEGQMDILFVGIALPMLFKPLLLSLGYAALALTSRQADS
jgi:hypothetical protein